MAQDFPSSPYPYEISPHPQGQKNEPSWTSENPSREEKSPFESSSEQSSSVAPEAEQKSYPEPEYDFDFDDDSARKNALMAMIAIVLVVVLAGVGVWYYFTRDKGPSEEPTPTDANLVVASKGGKITGPNGFEIVIPPHALREDTRIEIEKVASGLVTDLYHLKPDGLRFLKPVTLAIPYKPAGLREEETPYDIQLKYWLTAARNDTYFLEYVVDMEGKKLRTRVNEL